MRAPDIQFARRRDGRRMLGWAALALGAAFVVAGVMEYETVARALDGENARIAKARQELVRQSAEPASSAATRIPEQRVRAINHAIAQLNIPWRALFRAMEANQSKDVALLGLLPDARNHSLVVEGEALNPRAMLQFVERLREQPVFDEVHLTKHEQREQGASQPYRFSVEARWRGAR